jgi:hypothetical protein
MLPRTNIGSKKNTGNIARICAQKKPTCKGWFVVVGLVLDYGRQDPD